MQFDPDSSSLRFRSPEEANEFHLEITALVRAAMMQATRTIEDAEQAKSQSREVIREYRVVMRALNALRAALPRKQF